MDKNVFQVNSPKDTDPGAYLLLVTRGGGMMGSQTSAFAVDGVRTLYADGDGNPYVVEGYRGNTVITSFPTGMSWILINRENVTAMTNLAAAKASKKEQQLIDKLFEEPKAVAVETERPGNYL